MSAAEVEECSFCFCKGDSLADPRLLPCGHIICSRCLHEQSDQKTIECYACKAVHDMSRDIQLPVYGREGAPLCDVCEKDSVSRQPATIYCKHCKKMFCVSHRQTSHDMLFDDHPTIDALSYQDEKNVEAVCNKHQDQPLTHGCEICQQLVCGQCMFEPEPCSGGFYHQLKAINELVATLRGEIYELRDKLMEKEDQLCALFKQTSKSVAKFAENTEEMMRQLQVSREEQIEAINAKYEKMEKDVLDKRNAIQSKMKAYLEEDVGKGWADVSNERMLIQERIQNADNVTLITTHRETKKDVQQLAEKPTPSLSVDNVVALVQKDEQRDIEVGVVSTEDVHIGHRHEQSVPKVLPRTLTFLKSVDTSSQSYSISCVEGKTYVGCEGGHVDVTDKAYQLTKSFIKHSGGVHCVRVYNEKLYALVYVGGYPKYKVDVCDLSGRRVNSWPHAGETCRLSSQLAVVSDQVVIPDRSNNRLTVYSSDGNFIKYISFTLSAHWVGLCAAGTDSVIVSDYKASTVSRVDITTDEVLWTSEVVKSPRGVVSFPSGYVYVHGRGTRDIHVLNKDTGELMSRLSDANITGDAFDLEVDGDKLLVPVFSRNKVLFYRLK